MATDEFVAVARVTAPQGNRGEIRAIPLTDFPDRFRPALKLRARRPGTAVALEVQAARQHGRFVVIKFAGIDSISQAEALRDCLLEVPEADLVPLEPGRYYFHEIEGLDVVTASGRHIGKVRRVLRGKANDVYEIGCDAGSGGHSKTMLVPAVRDIVEGIDLDRREMTIRLIPGLE